MTEMTILKCDGVGCEAWIPAYPTPGSAEAEEHARWTQDDLDADICPKCHARTLNQEVEAAEANLGAFGQILEAEADKLHRAAEAQGLVQTTDFSKPEGDLTPASRPKVAREKFDKALSSEVKKLTKLLKKQGHDQGFIDEAVRELRTAAEIYYEVE